MQHTVNNEPIIMNQLPVPVLHGLIVCGGKSLRMGTDKSMLIYQQEPQRYHLYKMLTPICEQVFISCNAMQLNEMDDGYNTLVDLPAYENTGPMAALLTAFTYYPNNDLLVIGCDYPFLSGNDLHAFLQHCKAGAPAAFYHDKADLYEPLIAYYPCSSMSALLEMHMNGQYSLQQFLKNNNALKYFPENKKSIIGINTIEDYYKTKELISLHEK